MKLKKIVPDAKLTFGKTVFLGRGRDINAYDPITRQRTTMLEGRAYKLGSDVQGGEIEVVVPATVEELTFEYMEEVEIVKPVLTSRGDTKEKSEFAAVVYKCEVETIRKKGVDTPLKNTSNTGVKS